MNKFFFYLFVSVIAAEAAITTLTNFNSADFAVSPDADPTNVIRLKTTNTTYVYNSVTNNYTNTIFVENNVTNYVTNSVYYFNGVTNNFTNTVFVENYTTNYVTNSIYYYTGVTNYYTNNSTIYINGTNVATVNPTDGRLPVRASATSFADSPISIISPSLDDIMLDGGIFFAPGTSNLLKRSGANIVYTNGAANVDIEVINGAGKQALFGINTGGQVEVRAGTGVNALSLSDGSDIVTLFSTGLYPATYPINLGSTANPWGPNFYMAGFLSGTNYSRLSISHSGTNGAVTFDSQSFGTAGDPRPFKFLRNGVQYALFETNKIAIGLNAMTNNVDPSPTTAAIAIGRLALARTTTNQNLGIGDSVLANNTIGKYNIGVGDGALSSLIGDNRGNIGIGLSALYSQTNGSWNVALGHNALRSAISIYGSVAIGAEALSSQTGTIENIAIGNDALRLLTTGYYNVAVGGGAGQQANGALNTYIGIRAAQSATNGNSSVVVGYTALSFMTNIDKSVIIGAQNNGGTAPTYIDIFTNNLVNSIAIGFKDNTITNNVASLTNSIWIGHQIIATNNNEVLIGNKTNTVLRFAEEVGWYVGTGSPEGAVVANIGSFYSRKDGGAGTSFYVKESGTGNTGWVPK